MSRTAGSTKSLTRVEPCCRGAVAERAAARNSSTPRSRETRKVTPSSVPTATRGYATVPSRRDGGPPLRKSNCDTVRPVSRFPVCAYRRPPRSRTIIVSPLSPYSPTSLASAAGAGLGRLCQETGGADRPCAGCATQSAAPREVLSPPRTHEALKHDVHTKARETNARRLRGPSPLNDSSRSGDVAGETPTTRALQRDLAPRGGRRAVRILLDRARA